MLHGGLRNRRGGCDETAAEQRFEAAHRLLLALSQQCDTLTRAALAEAGYYQHHRGEWRPYGKKKASKQEESSDSQQAGQGPASTSAGIRRADGGSRESGCELQPERTWRPPSTACASEPTVAIVQQDTLIQYVNASPALKDSLGDMAQCAETALIETITKGDWLAARLLKQGAAELRQQVSRPSHVAAGGSGGAKAGRLLGAVAVCRKHVRHWSSEKKSMRSSGCNVSNKCTSCTRRREILALGPRRVARFGPSCHDDQRGRLRKHRGDERRNPTKRRACRRKRSPLPLPRAPRRTSTAQTGSLA